MDGEQGRELVLYLWVLGIELRQPRSHPPGLLLDFIPALHWGQSRRAANSVTFSRLFGGEPPIFCPAQLPLMLLLLPLAVAFGFEVFRTLLLVAVPLVLLGLFFRSALLLFSIPLVGVETLAGAC